MRSFYTDPSHRAEWFDLSLSLSSIHDVYGQRKKEEEEEEEESGTDPALPANNDHAFPKLTLPFLK